MSEEVPERVVLGRFRDLVGMFRFFAVLRRYGYIDPLIYSNDVDQIRNVVCQALREYKTYLDSARHCGETELQCLEIVDNRDNRFEDYQRLRQIFDDVIHECGDSLCLAPVIGRERRRIAYPSEEQVAEFLALLSQDGGLAYARALAGLALAR